MKLLASLLLLFSFSFSVSAQFDDDPDLDSPLMKAVKTNNLALVKKLVTEGADINEDSERGWKDVPVDVAVQNNYQAVALYLLEKGATSRRYFYSAVSQGNLEYIKKLVEYGYRDSESVLAAVETNNAALVEYLVGQGFDVNFSQKRRTGLFRKEYISPMDAATSGGNSRIIMALVKAGAPIDEAFTFACYATDQQLGVQILGLKKELDLLHQIAVSQNNLVLARKGVQMGANPQAMNADGYNVLHIAALKGTEQTLNYALNECEIPLDSKTSANENCLMIAAKGKNFALFSILLQKDVFGMEEVNQYGETVLYYAINAESVEMMRLLLGKKADVNHRDNLGVTPVMTALKSEKAILYEQFTGADINFTLKSNHGVDLLGYYMTNNYIKVSEIEWYVEKGCDPKGLDVNGANLAYHAVRTNNLPLLEKMKTWNVSLDPKDGNGRWPYSYSMEGEVIQFVINNGADPNRLANSGETYLQAAFRNKDIQLFALVLRSGASAKFETSSNTPFIFSLLDDKYLEYLKIAVEYGADVNVKDNWGDNVLEKAMEEDNTTSVVAFLKTVGARTQKEWAEFEVQRMKEMQSLAGLVKAGDLSAITYLLNKYPDIVLTKDQMNTLIVPAIRQENTEFIERLFDQGLMATTTVNFEQQTLAHIAVMEGKLNLLKLFVNKGADPLAADAYDKKPIDYAKNKEIKSYLKEQAKKKKS